MAELLPKQAYSKLMQSIKRIKEHWNADRQENALPYDIDHSLKSAIDGCITEFRIRAGGLEGRTRLIEGVICYLRDKGIIIKSPYGGHWFPD